eukprot:697014-Alexandrium_andersonii.AAC.1
MPRDRQISNFRCDALPWLWAAGCPGGGCGVVRAGGPAVAGVGGAGAGGGGGVGGTAGGVLWSRWWCWWCWWRLWTGVQTAVAALLVSAVVVCAGALSSGGGAFGARRAGEAG